MSRTHGSFKKFLYNNTAQALKEHESTDKLRNSGYTSNNVLKEKGWTTDRNLHSDMLRTEYRIQFNPKKEIHYKGPMFNTGILKKKEHVYKHM